MLCHLIISGFVQGVGFRQFVKKNALGLGLKGWVKNLPRRQADIDGSRVEVLFSGSKESMEKAIEICRQGAFLSDVKNIDIEWEDKNMDFNSFEIVI